MFIDCLISHVIEFSLAIDLHLAANPEHARTGSGQIAVFIIIIISAADIEGDLPEFPRDCHAKQPTPRPLVYRRGACRESRGE